MDSTMLEQGIAASPEADEVPPLLEPLYAQARARPEALALRAAGQALSYAGLVESVTRIAAGLHAIGVRAGDIVALTAERQPATVTLLLGILRAGGVCLPLDSTLPPARLRAMLEDARPRLLVASENPRMRWPSQIPRCERGELEATGAIAAPPAEPAGAELAYVLFTSGTTGRPKGIAQRCQAVDAVVRWHQQHPRLGLAARTLQFGPYGFDVAFQEILTTLAVGGTLILAGDAERRDPWALLKLIVREYVERMFLPVPALHALAEAVVEGGGIPLDLRDVITAGEQLRVTPAVRALFAALPDSALHNQYGPTETFQITDYELHGDPQAWPELPPIGKVMPHVRTRVVDAELNPVVPGTEGELLLGGTCLAAGYLHRPDLTGERFIQLDGARWYRSGDRVRESADGVLTFIGRVDGQIKLHGYRIEPAEIEVVLSKHPAVAEVAVVAAETAQGKQLVAHLVAHAGHGDDESLAATLREHCRTELPAWMVPQRFVVHAALPQTATGKIDRRVLASEAEQAPIAWPQEAPLRDQLHALWAQLLGRADLDVHANLFDQGARSLTVVRALTEMRRHGLDGLRVAQIYEYPTVDGQTALLTGAAEPMWTDAARQRAERQRGALARFAREGAQ